MPHMQAVGRGVKADVKGCLAIVDQFLDFLLVGELGDQPLATSSS